MTKNILNNLKAFRIVTVFLSFVFLRLISGQENETSLNSALLSDPTQDQPRLTFNDLMRQENKSCKEVRGLGNPINIFHQYFRQTIQVFNPKQKKTEVKLLYYRMQKSKVHVHRFVFRLKNTYANRFEYVGIVSVVPKKELESERYRHFIVRYINSSDLVDTVTLLGVYEAKSSKPVHCPKMKEKWLDYLIEHPYVVTECKQKENPDCVTSEQLTLMFGLIFQFLQKVLLSFGIEVTVGELGFNPVILNVYKLVFKDFDFILVSFSILKNNLRKQ